MYIASAAAAMWFYVVLLSILVTLKGLDILDAGGSALNGMPDIE